MLQTAFSATPAALAHIKKMLAKKGAGIGIRLSVKNSGCSGKSYIVSLVETSQPEDLIYTLDDNIVLCVDPHSYAFVSGSIIDYERKGLNGKLVFRNPHEKASCGCGESFHV